MILRKVGNGTKEARIDLISYNRANMINVCNLIKLNVRPSLSVRIALLFICSK